MIQKDDLIYVVTGMCEGELCKPYFPKFDVKRIQEMHSWLKEVNHKNYAESEPVNQKAYRRLADKKGINRFGVCGSFEEACVLDVANRFLQQGLEVYVPKKFLFMGNLTIEPNLRKNIESLNGN